MKGESITGNQTFAEDFLIRLHKIFNCLQPGKIKEQRRAGMLFFKQKHTRICLYNVYPGSVQIIFNRNLLSNHFEASHDYGTSAPIDWELITAIITDILKKTGRQEKEHLRFNNNLSRSHKIPKTVLKDPDSDALRNIPNYI